jgi:Flp pilus assembly protein TadG
MINTFFRRLTIAVVAGCRKLNDNSGNATIELALAFSVLVTPLMLGTAETAFLVYDSIEISNAAHAGAMYGMISSTFAGDNTGIQNAARADASDLGTSLTVTPTVYYACSAAPTGTHYTTEASAGAACPKNASNHYLQFIQVASTATITPPLKIPGMPGSWNLQGLSVMEVQE